ncbi:MAG TPA: TIM barrel protein, partial [Bryobacteraceae bacterium]|nr:TIM barrel protein [Bryobacteraceae bacterium]
TEPKPFLVLADNNGTDPERTQNAGRIIPTQQLSALEWTVFAENANRLAREVLDGTSIKTVFHHHCAGYVETPEEIAQFLRLTDERLIGLVFDTGHYAYGSGSFDVIEALERFRDRIWYVHLKDCSASVAAQAARNQWNYFEALRHGIFCELGKGQIDFAGVLNWLGRNNYDGYVVVEQDILPGMGTPKESAMRNRNYLRSVSGL